MESAVEQVENVTETAMSGYEANVSELDQPRWAVVSFESVAFRNLTYEEARVWVARLENQRISGLCIITDEAAARSTN